MKVNLVGILSDLYFGISIPTFVKTLTYYRLHSLPTQYRVNGKTVKNKIIIPNKYIGVDNDLRTIHFLEDINNIQSRRCGKAEYLHLNKGIVPTFEFEKE